MRAALREGDLIGAWEFSDDVLKAHPDDSRTITMVARMAHDLGKPDVAAELLVKAARADQFQHEAQVQQAMVAMIGVGRLYDGMAMLEEAVKAQPQQHASRRWLFDFYIGTENRIAAVPHGRYLVRQRKFDVDLLTSLSNTERRTLENTPLAEMITRNPDDKRPLLGAAKSKFDARDFAESLDILRTIVSVHDNYLPAEALLGRVLAASGRFNDLESWSEDQPDAIQQYTDYWIAVGDWARAKDEHTAAARAYWEATQRDPDVMECWSKLNTALRRSQALQKAPPTKTADETMLDQVERRANLLSKLSQSKHRFERTGNISRETAVEIARTLRELGRLWEAEAWAAIATTLPEDDAVSVDEERQAIVAILREDTPWQLAGGHPELRLDLSSWKLPAISKVAIAMKKQSDADSGVDAPTDIRLVNEANKRGVDFFGRTSPRLDQPDIRLYQTLGCGGATIDFDLDGWHDIYLLAAEGTPPNRDSYPNALFRNINGAFQNRAKQSGTADIGFGQGAAVGDINEDGFPDLLVLNYGPNTLLINNGDGTFTDASGKLGKNGDSWSVSASIADLNVDGISDLVTINYCAGQEPVTRKCLMEDSDKYRACTPMAFPAEPDQFFQGTLEGNLVDRTTDWGAVPDVLGRGLGIVVGALDHRQGLDVFVANDMTNNHYWSSTGKTGSFRLSESAILRGLAGDDRALAQGSMGIATGDLDQDGDIDLYVTNFFKEYNTLHDQRGEGIWQDRTASTNLSGPTMPWVGFGTEAVDLNHDGNLELVVTNGHVDMFERNGEHSVYAHPMQIFRRNESRTYQSIGETMDDEYVVTPHVGRALWTIDADRDRRTDLVVTHQTEPVALLMNRSETRGDWVEIRLVGRQCARDAIGSIITLTDGETKWITALTSGDGYMCSNERILRFGLGEINDDSLSVEVVWPDGSGQTHSLNANQSWLIVQSDAAPHRFSAGPHDQ